MTRSHVAFDGLWAMAIDVPYSYLVRDGDLAWTCGQLALDADATVLHPGDLAAQSEVVCDHLEEILERAGLSAEGLRRLLLYYVHTGHDDRDAMLHVVSRRLGSSVDLVPIAVPHFYYDGIVLEVDVFWGGPAAELRWVEGARGPARLSEHIVSPTGIPADHLMPADPGAVLDGGSHMSEARTIGVDVVDGEVTTTTDLAHGVSTVVRRSGPFLWVQGRSNDGGKPLVRQTEAVMRRLDEIVNANGFGFGDVVKSTTHYVGGSTAEELHDNMRVRNAYYRAPGPASTGIPVFGFADPASRIVVDITLLRR